MKQIVILLIAMLSSLMVNAQTLIEGIYYELNTYNKQATVMSGETAYTGTVRIPETVTYEDVTYNVTSIGNRTFQNCSELTIVSIPNSVTYLGQYAFEGCTGINSVLLPNGVTSIENGTFSGCSGLTEIIIPGSVKTIYDDAFYNCSSLTTVNISEGVTTISGNAFYNCSSLTEVTIPNSVSSIGQNAFFGCSKLASITIPNSVTSIGSQAFYGTQWYDNQPDGLVYAGSVAYKYKGTMPQNTSMYIKEGTLSISRQAFSSCSSMTSVIIPSTLKSIGNWAFSDCSDLVDVYCYARKGPTASSSIFNNSGIQFATLHVPEISINGYKTTEPWNEFGNIFALQDGDPKPDSESEPELDPTPEYIRGDVNLDGIVNGTDIQEVINIIVNGDFSDEKKFEPRFRFGFYETVPDYDVTIDNIYVYSKNTSALYYSNTINTVLSSTSANPTWDKNGDYTTVSPNENNTEPVFIMLDYHLTATDGSANTIRIRNAEVAVPALYSQWQYNKDYTYIFKISKKTIENSEDPNPVLVTDLFPITLDKFVVNGHNDGQTIITR